MSCLKTEYFMEASKLVREFGKKKINGRTIEEAFTYGDMPFWNILKSDIVTFMWYAEGNEGRKLDSGGFMKRYAYRYLYRTAQLKRRYINRKRRAEKSSAKNRILVIPLIQTNLPIIKPVIDELKNSPDNEVVVLRYDFLRSRMKGDMRKIGIDYIDMESYASTSSDRRAGKAEASLKDSMKAIVGYETDDRQESLIKMFLMGLFSNRSRITEITRYIEAMRNVLEAERPDVLVTMDESSCIGMPTVLMAKDMGIKTIGIQHGQTEDVGPAYVDRLAVWDSYTKGYLVKRGYDRKQLIVTGCPKYDSMARVPERSIVLRNLGLSEGERIFVFATQDSSANEAYVSMLFSAIRGFPQMRLVVKMHPRERDSNVYRQAEKNAGISTIVTRNDLYGLIAASDVFITKSSMAALEAVLMEKPVIIFDPTDRKDLTSFSLVERGAAIGVFNQNGLHDAINNILHDRETQERLKIGRSDFISDCGFRNDGKSSERVAKLVTSMIEDGGEGEENRVAV